jgi:hypothetical protein
MKQHLMRPRLGRKRIGAQTAKATAQSPSKRFLPSRQFHADTVQREREGATSHVLKIQIKFSLDV